MGVRRFRAWALATRARELGVLAAGLVTVQAALLAVDHGPYFFPDSGSYLLAVHSLAPRRTRQIGVSYLWRGVLAVRHSLLLLVVVQTLLMTVAALLAYAAARELGARRRAAAVGAAAVALSPTALFFQRMLLSEVLASVLLTATVYLLVRGRSGAVWRRILRCAAAGLAAAAAVCVRSDLELVPLAAVLALVLFAAERRPAVVGPPVLAFVVACGGLLVADMARTQQVTGSFSLAPWSGVVAIARAAPYVDCSLPDRPPAVRREVCAEGITHRSYDAVIWRRGFVNSVLSEPTTQFRRDNGQLLRLAEDSIVQDPDGYADSVADTAAGDFGLSDPNSYEYSTKPLPFTAAALASLHLHDRGRVSHPLFHPLQVLARPWSAARWLIPVAALALLMPTRTLRTSRRRGPLLGLAVIWIATIVPALMFGDHVPRYVFSTEGIGWVLVASVASWLAATRRSAPEPDTSR